MTFVIDASVAVKFVTHEAGSDRALAYLDSTDELIAPDLVLVETANALLNKVKESELLEVHADRAFDDLPLFFSRLEPTIDHLSEAFRLAFRLRHAVYDCVYLAVAMAEGAQVVTADRKFVAAVSRVGLDRHVLAL